VPKRSPERPLVGPVAGWRDPQHRAGLCRQRQAACPFKTARGAWRVQLRRTRPAPAKNSAPSYSDGRPLQRRHPRALQDAGAQRQPCRRSGCARRKLLVPGPPAPKSRRKNCCPKQRPKPRTQGALQKLRKGPGPSPGCPPSRFAPRRAPRSIAAITDPSLWWSFFTPLPSDPDLVPVYHPGDGRRNGPG